MLQINRDLNLDVPAADGRRIEVVANGLPSWQGAQIAVDATIVSPVRREGSARPGADSEPGLVLAQALDRKHRTYPELQRARRCKLVVFGVERRSTLTFLRATAGALVRCGGSASACAAIDSPRLVSSAARARVFAGAARGRVARRPPGWRGGPVGRPFGPPPDSRLPGRTG